MTKKTTKYDMKKITIISVIIVAILLLISLNQLGLIFVSDNTVMEHDVYFPNNIRVTKLQWVAVEFTIPDDADFNTITGFQMKGNVVYTQGLAGYRGGFSKVLTTDSSKWLTSPQEHQIPAAGVSGWLTTIDSISLSVDRGETFYYIGMLFTERLGQSVTYDHFGSPQYDASGFKSYRCPSGGEGIPPDSLWTDVVIGPGHLGVFSFKVFGLMDGEWPDDPDDPIPPVDPPDDPDDPDDPPDDPDPGFPYPPDTPDDPPDTPPNIYQKPSQDIPIFEILLFIIAIGIIFLILKRRKKDG